MKYAVLMAALAVASPVAAQENCAPREVVIPGMAESGFVVAAQMFNPDVGIIEILINEDGYWVMHVVRPDGMACYAMEGEGFGIVEPEPAGTLG